MTKKHRLKIKKAYALVRIYLRGEDVDEVKLGGAWRIIHEFNIGDYYALKAKSFWIPKPTKRL